LEENKSNEIKHVDNNVQIEETNEIPQTINAEEATKDVGDEECDDTSKALELEANKSDEMKDVDTSVAIGKFGEIPSNMNATKATKDDVGDEECEETTIISKLEEEKNAEEAIEDNVGDKECKHTTEASEFEANKSDEMKDVERSIAIEESTEISLNLMAEEIIEDDVGDKECKDAIEVAELEANKSDEMKEVENSAGIEESNEILQSLNVEEAIEDNVGDEECKDTTEVSEWEADKSDEMKDVERNIAIEESTEIPPNINVEETTKDDVDDEECKDAIQVSELEANK
ncbi:unnamed protein product, partial [Sphagnum troendelagicum]